MKLQDAIVLITGANRGIGLKMRVIAYDPFLSDGRAVEIGVGTVELDDLLARAERVVDDAALSHVLELGAHEGTALAGLDVLEIDDGIRLPVELDLQPLLELCRGHLHDVMAPSVSGSWPAAPLRDGRGPGHRPDSSV